MVSNTTKFIDFIGANRFNSIANSYLVNLYNCMKTKEKEIQVNLFIPLMSFRYGKKIKGLKHSKHLFIWSGRFQISKMNLRTILFQVEGSDVGHDQIFKFYNYLLLVLLCNFCYFWVRLFISFFSGVFNVVLSN